MKCLVIVAVAALTFAGLATPASAFTSSPSISVIPLTPIHAGVVTSRPGCTAAASVDGTPYWEMPAIAAGQGIAGTAQVKIELSAAGALAHEAIFSSSGNRWLDAAAMLSARMSRFNSEIVNCERVAGSYLYQVSF